MAEKDNTFKLSKLGIDVFSDWKRSAKAPDQSGLPPGPGSTSGGNTHIEVMFNPASLAWHHETDLHADPAPGVEGGKAEYKRSFPSQLAMDLVIDGTGVHNVGIAGAFADWPSVSDQVKRFLYLCHQKHGELHQPNFLTVLWGEDMEFRCRLQSVDVNYTSFDRHGSPLRASLSVRFLGDTDPVTDGSNQEQASPDLTHTRIVHAGDTLPLMCKRIYGSEKHYLRVAAFNGLDSFRHLAPGTEIQFPPLERGARSRG